MANCLATIFCRWSMAIVVFAAAVSAMHDAAALTTYSIGNSLTQDTRPQFLPDAQWHIYCAKNLHYIYNNPTEHCVGSSRQWDDALVNSTYDYVIVQPHFGTTLSQDAAAISSWMNAQPASTKWVLHTGWARAADLVATYDGTFNGQTMTHHLDYYQALIDDLAVSNPAVQIVLNPAVVLLRNIADDIAQGTAPYNALSELYRDEIHISLTDGQYVQHNLLRTTLGLPINTEDFPAVTSANAAYLNSKIAELVPLAAAIPEPTAWAFGALVSTLYALRAKLRRRRPA